MSLLVSGCSFTEHMPSNDGIQRRWCHYVADRLDVELINLGKSGAGNEYIFCSLYDAIIKSNKKPSRVIAAWSKCQRRDYKIKGVWTNDRQDLRGDLEYHIERTNRYKKMLTDLCKYRGINYKSFQMIELYSRDRDNVQAKTIGFDNEWTPDFISDIDKHPSEIGHEKIGKYIYENL
jgi:hypothetical protein